jgi:hypothetical protein
MQLRKRDSHFLLAIKKLSPTKSLQPLAMETWLVLILILVMLLTAIAISTWLDSSHADQTDLSHQDLTTESVC